MGSKEVLAILGAGAIVGGTILLTGRASASACIQLDPGVRYYGIYVWPTQRVKLALGECYPVIWTLDVYNEDENDYIPVVNPEQDYLISGSKIAVQVQAPCKLCGFNLKL